MGVQLHIMYSFTVGLLSSVIANYVYIMRPLQTHICTQNIRYLIIVISDALLWHESFDSIVQYSLKYRTSYLSHLRRTIQIIFAENRGKKLQTDLLVSEFGSDRKVQPERFFVGSIPDLQFDAICCLLISAWLWLNKFSFSVAIV